MYFHDFIILELHKLLSIKEFNAFLNLTLLFREYKRKLYIWNFDGKNSMKYLEDVDFYNHMNELLCNGNTQLSIRTNSFNTENLTRIINPITNIYKLTLCMLSYTITDDFIKRFENIQILELIRNYSITDECCLHISKIKTLHTLDLHCSPKLTDEGFKHLGNIHTLGLVYCKITDEGLKYLGNVHTLDLSFNEKITDEGLKYLGKVHTLNLNWCKLVTIGCLKYLENIHNLSLYDCKCITKLTEKDLKLLGKIHTLKLNHSLNITDECLKHLGNCHTLHLPNCYSITNITPLAKCYKLDLTGCKNISDGISHLGNVHTLDLSNCDKITDEDIKHLGNVHTLDLTGCKNLTNECIKYLGKCHTLSLRPIDLTDDCLKYLVNVNTLEISCKIVTSVSVVNHLYNVKDLTIYDADHIHKRDVKSIQCKIMRMFDSDGEYYTDYSSDDEE